jgi:hypothetical protein
MTKDIFEQYLPRFVQFLMLFDPSTESPLKSR